MRLDIIEALKSTPDSISIRFKKPSGLKYKAGQHGQFHFLFKGERVSRTYSFNSAPGVDNDIAITVKSVENGVVSQRLLKGEFDSIELETVNGNFFIERSHDLGRHLIMFAGGSGITPIFSMIRFALHNEPASTISLLYSNSYSDGIIFKKELQDLQMQFSDRFKIYFVITREDLITEDLPVFFKGRLPRLIVKKFIKTLMTEVNGYIEYYLCGPYPFMSLIEDAIHAFNIDRRNVFKEHFFIPPSEEAQFDVSTLHTTEIIVALKNEEKLLIVEAGKSILQAALANNIRLAHSCTEGQCGVCRSMLLSGEVKLRKNHVLTEDELKQGQILLCQGFPISDNVAVRPLN